MIKCYCQACGSHLGIADGLAGQAGTCPKCGASFVVPTMGQGAGTGTPVAVAPEGARVAFSCTGCGMKTAGTVANGVVTCEYCDAPHNVAQPPQVPPPGATAQLSAPSPPQPVVVNVYTHPAVVGQGTPPPPAPDVRAPRAQATHGCLYTLLVFCVAWLGAIAVFAALCYWGLVSLGMPREASLLVASVLSVAAGLGGMKDIWRSVRSKLARS